MVGQATTEMFERTERCHYTDICESFQVMKRAERWMERSLSKLRITSGSNQINFEDFKTMESLQGRLAHLRKVKERCYRYNGRCLRFWQFKAKDGLDPRLLQRKSDIFSSRFMDDLMEDLQKES